MNPELQRLLDTVWQIENARTSLLYREREQEILGKAAASGLIDSNGTFARIGEAYLALLDEKASDLIAQVQRTLKAKAYSPSAEDRDALLARFDQTLSNEASDAQSALNNLRRRGGYPIIEDPLMRESPGLRRRRYHDFEIMLAELDHGADKSGVVSNTFNFSGSQQVQIGDHNVQHAVVVFRDLLAKIDSANADPAQKAEAKSRLKAFLEHPLTSAIAGGLAGGLADVLKSP